MSTPSRASSPFDEQLWPIHLALAAWACVLAGVAVALGGFDDPRLWQNGWARLATIAATLALLAWAASTVNPRHSRRLKLAAVLSLIFHTLLAVALCRQRMEFLTPPLADEQIATHKLPADEAVVQEFPLDVYGQQPGREPFERPVSTGAAAPAESQLTVEHRTPADTQLPQQPISQPEAKPQLVPRPEHLWRPQQALAQEASLLAERSRRPRRDAAPAFAVADAHPEPPNLATPPARSTRGVPLPADRTNAPPSADLARHDRSAAPRLAFQAVSSVPELPAVVPTQDLPRQSPADPLPTIALDSSRARSRRRVEAAPLPEMPAETDRLADQTMTRATRILDGQPTDPAQAPDTPRFESAARAGAADTLVPRSDADAAADLARSVASVIAGSPLAAGAPDTQTAGRLSISTLRRRRSAEADPGLRSGGGLDRPRRSRGPSPAAPVMAPLPLVATTTPSARQPADATEPPATNSGVVVDSARPPPDQIAGNPTDTPDDNVPRAPVVVDAPSGDGGLGRTLADVAGLPDRLAARSADLIHMTPARLPNRRSGGEPAPSGATRYPTAAFSRRHVRQELPGGGEGQPSAKTEAAIELGLEFLARAQLDDGRWQFAHLGGEADGADAPPSIRADAAATGLALLSFLGAGYDHFGDRYQHVVENGLDYLVRTQAPTGEIFPESGQTAGQVVRFYGHGIATLALCEAYGMTGDPQLRRPAQAAIDYLAATQHPERGGWRYAPGTNADLSVTGWQLLALRSGELAGLTVRPETYQGIRYLVERCREEGGRHVRFCYNPWASPADPRTRHGRQPSTVMTSVGLLMQLYLGGDRNDRRTRLAADHLLANLPQMGDAPRVAPTGTLGNPSRDTYYWYYATQVMFHMGGPYWEAWNGRLHLLLVESQTRGGPLAGSWDPTRPVPDKWAAYGGRLYVTTMNLLSLEVYYRHLPLYDRAAPRVAERP